jgi:GrpB-like predicted nucleotidyltransferase (UPF0157 family)
MQEPLGLESQTVRLAPYDDRWPGLFEAESARIVDAMAAAGSPPLAIEHVGSTAVPGLAAKPILDIAAGRSPDTLPATYIPILESLGYIYRGDGGLPGREFFRRGVMRSHHIHLVEVGGTHWCRYLRFRDALRGDPAIRDAYANLKHALASQFPRDREAYIAGKADFVERVVRGAGG